MKNSIDWPKKYLPKNIREGDILTFSMKKDKEEIKNAEKRVKNLIDKLSKKDN